jgi:hypothetical protein
MVKSKKKKKCYGEIIVESWGNHGEIMGKSWGNHGEIMGKS